MNTRLWLSVFFFCFAVAVLLAGYFLTKGLMNFIIAGFVAYIYGLVGLLFLGLGLRDKLNPEFKI